MLQKLRNKLRITTTLDFSKDRNGWREFCKQIGEIVVNVAKKSKQDHSTSIDAGVLQGVLGTLELLLSCTRNQGKYWHLANTIAFKVKPALKELED